MEILNKVSSLLRRLGADDVGFYSDKLIIPDSLTPAPLTVVTMVFKIDCSIINRITELEKDFHSAQLEKKKQAGEIIVEAEKMLSGLGYKVFELDNAQDSVTLKAPLSYKEYAVKSGLGWIGKNSLLISNRCGPGIYLASFITDLPAPENASIINEKCGTCTLCAEKCPPGAVKGKNWSVGLNRDDLIDAFLCSSYRLNNDKSKSQQRKDSCGICIQVCPFVHKTSK